MAAGAVVGVSLVAFFFVAARGAAFAAAFFFAVGFAGAAFAVVFFVVVFAGVAAFFAAAGAFADAFTAVRLAVLDTAAVVLAAAARGVFESVALVRGEALAPRTDFFGFVRVDDAGCVFFVVAINVSLVHTLRATAAINADAARAGRVASKSHAAISKGLAPRCDRSPAAAPTLSALFKSSNAKASSSEAQVSAVVIVKTIPPPSSAKRVQPNAVGQPPIDQRLMSDVIAATPCTAAHSPQNSSGDG